MVELRGRPVSCPTCLLPAPPVDPSPVLKGFRTDEKKSDGQIRPSRPRRVTVRVPGAAAEPVLTHVTNHDQLFYLQQSKAEVRGICKTPSASRSTE